MRRAFFFIVAVCLATPSFASIPRASALDLSSPSFDALSETRIRVSEDLARFERPAPSLLSRALRQGYEQASTTNASGLAGFLSVDPVLDTQKALKEPQRWNRYSYVINNPLRYTDPDGRQMKPEPCGPDKCPPPPVETVLRLTPQNIDRMAKSNAGNTTPTMRSATNGTPPTPGAVTVSAGVTASFVAIGGGSVNASVMRTANRIGPEHSAVAASGGVHTASPRASLGVQATFGIFRGVPADQRGATSETNFTIGPAGVSLVFTRAGGLVGVTGSYGPSIGAGISTSESGTVVLTGQDVLNKVDIDPWR